MKLTRFPLVSSNFWFNDSFGETRRRGGHQAIDIFADAGTPIIAPLTCRVISIIVNERAGFGVEVLTTSSADNPHPLRIVMSHMRRVDVQAGDAILPAGTRLGEVGNTGNARTTRPHLHFQVWRGLTGPTLNPYEALRIHTAPIRGTARMRLREGEFG